MSHFYTLVITEKNNGYITDEDVEPLLAPFDENLEVPEYDARCYCVGRKAQVEVRNIINGELGDIDVVREKFNSLHPYPDMETAGTEAFVEVLNRNEELWRKEIANPRQKRQNELMDGHPLSDQPDPDCEQCHGSGAYKSTYNPYSKWDWYVLGGRWDDIQPQQGYAPEFAGNIPFAIVTPEGDWHANGKMGWFGTVTEQEEYDWAEVGKALLLAYPDNLAVVCDLHI